MESSIVSTGALAPSALITKSAPSPSVRDLAHSPEELSPSVSTSIRSGAQFLDALEEFLVAPGAEDPRDAQASASTVDATPRVPVTPSISATVPGPASAIRRAP